MKPHRQGRILRTRRISSGTRPTLNSSTSTFPPLCIFIPLTLSSLRAQEEDEEWKKTAYFYEAYTARERRRIDERRHAPRTALPDERQLNERLRHGLRLANAPPDADPGGLAAQIRTRLPDLQFKFDMLHMNLHAARTCARVAGRALDTRFGLLDAGLGGLAARTRAQTNAEAGPSGVAATATHEVLRALASVDMERPLTKVGDAARRAARLQGPIEFA
jgi:kinetochore protein Mis13/DSN1